MANTLIRHVGRLKNTGQRCVVIYRQIPGEENSALIVQSDQLPDQYHDNLMNVLNSDPAQQTHNFFEILARRKFGDGTPMLESLHQRNFLKKVPVSEVVLYPQPNLPLPLEDANAAIGDLVFEENDANVNTDTNTNYSEPATNPSFSQSSDVKEDASSVAASKLAQAEVLERDVNRLREEAYKLDPTLKPSRGRPELSEEERERRREEYNRRRREKYHKNKSKKEKATKPAENSENNDLSDVSSEKVLKHLERKHAEKEEGKD